MGGLDIALIILSCCVIMLCFLLVYAIKTRKSIQAK